MSTESRQTLKSVHDSCHDATTCTRTLGRTMTFRRDSFRMVWHTRTPCLALSTCRMWAYWRVGRFGTYQPCIPHVWKYRNWFHRTWLKSADHSVDTGMYRTHPPIQSCRIIRAFVRLWVFFCKRSERYGRPDSSGESVVSSFDIQRCYHHFVVGRLCSTLFTFIAFSCFYLPKSCDLHACSVTQIAM